MLLSPSEHDTAVRTVTVGLLVPAPPPAPRAPLPHAMGSGPSTATEKDVLFSGPSTLFLSPFLC